MPFLHVDERDVHSAAPKVTREARLGRLSVDGPKLWLTLKGHRRVSVYDYGPAESSTLLQAAADARNCSEKLHGVLSALAARVGSLRKAFVRLRNDGRV